MTRALALAAAVFGALAAACVTAPVAVEPATLTPPPLPPPGAAEDARASVSAPLIDVIVKERRADGTGDAARLVSAPLAGAEIVLAEGGNTRIVSVPENPGDAEEAPSARRLGSDDAGLARVDGSLGRGRAVKIAAPGHRTVEVTLPEDGSIEVVLDTAGALAVLGRAAELLWRDDVARARYEEALQLDPALDDAKAGLARMRAYAAAAAGDDMRGALDLLLAAWNGAQDGRLAWTLGTVAVDAGRPDLALAAADVCARDASCPGDAAWLRVVAALRQAALRAPPSADEAGAALTGALAWLDAQPALDARVAGVVGDTLAELRQRVPKLGSRAARGIALLHGRSLLAPVTAAEAEEAFRGGLAAARGDPELQFWLGEALVLQGKRDAAVEAWTKAAAKPPSGSWHWVPLAFLRLGEQTLSATGNGNAAWRHFEQAAAHSGEDPAILLRIGVAYERTGKIDLAETIYDRVAAGPPSPEAAAAQALLQGDVGEPASRYFTSPSDEAGLCDGFMETLRAPLATDAAAIARVERIGARLNEQVEDITIRWHVVQSAEINAFALPGQCITVFTGLLDYIDANTKKPDEVLAAVLAHELAHVTQRHGIVKMRAGWLGGLRAGVGGGEVPTPAVVSASLAQIRANEIEADELAVRTLLRAGFDPSAAAEYFQALIRTGHALFHAGYSHPTDPERIDIARREIWKIAAANAAYEDAVRDLRALSGESAERAWERLNAAVDAIYQMVSTLPRAPEPHYNLALAYQLMSRLGAQALRWRWNLEPDPRAVLPDLSVAGARGAYLGGPAQARARALAGVRRALALRPEYASARALHAALLAEEGRLEEAGEEAARLVGPGPRAPAWAWNAAGVVAAMRDDRPAAEAAFKRALETDPRAAVPAFNLALLYARSGRAEARAAWERYLALGEPGAWAEVARKALAAAAPPEKP